MKRLRAVILGIGILSLLFIAPVYANYTNLLDQASEVYQKYCERSRPPRVLVISCYLFSQYDDLKNQVVSNQQTAESLEGVIQDQSQAIVELDTRIRDLENPSTPTETPAPTPTPEPTAEPMEFTFINWYIPNDGVESRVAYVNGLTEFDFYYDCGLAATLNLAYSDDEVNWNNQLEKTAEECEAGGGNLLPVIGKYYKVIIGPAGVDDPDQFVFAQGRFR